MGLPKWTKSNKSCSRKKHIEVNGCLFLRYYWITDPIVIVLIEKRRMVNSELYVTICLSEVFREIWKRSKNMLIILHHGKGAQKRTIWPAKTLNSWVIHHIALIWPPMTFSYSHTSKKLCGQQFLKIEEKQLMHTKHIFGVTATAMEKVPQKFIQTHAKVYWSSWRLFWKTITIKPISTINIHFFIIRPEI